MIHIVLWVASALLVGSIGGSIVFAVFSFVSSQKQKRDHELRWCIYCARVEAEEAALQAAGRGRRAQQVGRDLLDTFEKIDDGYGYKIKGHGHSWIH